MAALLSRIVRNTGPRRRGAGSVDDREAASAADDVEAQALWRSIRAPILAHLGRLEEAEMLARAARDLARKTEVPTLQADALAELACVLALAQRGNEAQLAVEEAISLYAAKGDQVSLKRWADWAARLAG